MTILVRKIGAVLRRSSMIPEQEHNSAIKEETVFSRLASSVVLYVLGTSHEMTVYVRTQQIVSGNT